MKPLRFLAPLLAAALLPALLSAAPLRVGVGRADITPNVGQDELTGMGGKAAVVEKINDPLATNVIVFEQDGRKVALVSLDLIGIGNEVFDGIRAALERDHGITQTLCAVTHTHGSGFYGETFHPFLIQRTLEAANAAVASLEPALVGQAATVHNEGYNRRILNDDGTVSMMWNNKDRTPSEPVDDTLGVIAIRRASDRTPLVTLVNYAVHPVISMNFDELIISADWPGAMAREVEATVGGHCVFLLGAAGDLNPYDADMFRYATADEVFAKVEEVGLRVAAEVTEALDTIDTFHADAALAYDAYDIPMGLRQDGPHASKEREVELATFLLAERYAIVTIPGELFVELGQDLQARSPAKSTWIMANAYDSSGYLPTMQAACQGGYGAAWGTVLEFGAGERLVHQALVSLHHQMKRVVPLRAGP